jgi:hypothetical protein
MTCDPATGQVLAAMGLVPVSQQKSMKNLNAVEARPEAAFFIWTSSTEI